MRSFRPYACLRLSLLLLISGCGKETADRGDHKSESPAKPITSFLIPEIEPIGDTATETRLRLDFLQGDATEFHVRLAGPNYQLEVSPGPFTSGTREYLSWAPGAVHEYSGRTTGRPATSKALSSHVSFRLAKPEIIDGKEYYSFSSGLVVFDEGEVLIPNRLSGWQILASDSTFPLTFKLVKGKGYVYMCGKGAVQDPNGKRRTLGPGSLSAWIAGLRSADPVVREGSALALGWLGHGRSEVTRALSEAAEDKAPAVRRGIAEALGRLRSIDSLDVLSRLVRDEHAWTVETARWATEQIQEGGS